jgi:hypothetical protein
MNNSHSYEWSRFWVPADGRLAHDENGFLRDPEGQDSKYLQPQVAKLDEFTKHQCLILLGEQGIGKSHEIAKAHRDAIANNLNAFIFDLALCTSGESLFKELFQSDAWINRQDEGTIHIFLDSLDECPLKALLHLLVEQFAKQNTKGLHLCIGCRTAYWSKYQKDLLRDVFHDNIQEIELTPLRSKDIELAATVNEIDSVAFIEEVVKRGLSPLATLPITLELLFYQYRERKNLEVNKATLFEDGCLALCATTEKHRVLGVRNQYSPPQRLSIAKRIAAMMKVCGLPSLRLDDQILGQISGDLYICQIGTGREAVLDQEFEVTQQSIIETLNTGLFMSLGDDRITFRHQSLIEYMAASFLVSHFPPSQIYALISIEGDIPNEMSSLASWLAVVDPGNWVEMLLKRPEVLLRNEIVHLSDDSKAKIINRLFDAVRERRLHAYDNKLQRRSLSQLRHADISSQLGNVLVNRDESRDVRILCARIARECIVTELLDQLVNISLDTSESTQLRAVSILAIAEFGEVPHRLNLILLAENDTGDDPDDELKGAAFEALWPEVLNTGELLSLLTRPKRENLFGLYRSFLYGIPEQLATKDLPMALSWAEGQSLDHWIESNTDRLIIRAWQHLNDEETLNQFIKLAAKRLLAHEHVFPWDAVEKGEIIVTTESRRRILPRLFNVLADDERAFASIVFSSIGKGMWWVIPEDFDWLLGLLKERKWSAAEERLIARLLRHKANYNDLNQLDEIVRLYVSGTPIIKEVFKYDFEPRILGSQQAVNESQEWQRELSYKREMEKREKEREPEVPPIETLLQKAESGGRDQWYGIWRVLQYDRSNGSFIHGPNYDINKLPGWNSASNEIRRRVLSAALKYLKEGAINSEDWISSESRPMIVEEAYAAFRSVLSLAPEKLSSFSPHLWRKWAPVLVASPFMLRDEGTVEYTKLKHISKTFDS